MTIFGLGTFNLVTRGPRTVNNPMVGGKPQLIPEKKVVKFEVAKQFKEAAAG